MRGLSLTQPWASLVALGHKRVETRGWRTHYRGRVAIHAAKGFPAEARYFAECNAHWAGFPDPLPLGAIVAVADLVRCSHIEDVAHELSHLERALGDYAPGRFAWFLADIKPLREPIPCRGALGLWLVPADLLPRLP